MNHQSLTLGASVLKSARARAFFTAAVAFFIFTSAAHSISAATYTVTTVADTGAGSLRDAVSQANGTAAADVIVFNIPAASCNATTGVCTITLTGGEIGVQSAGGALTISGTGANRLTISGNNASRIFYSDGATFTLSGVTLTNGNGSGGAGGAFAAINGTVVLRGVNVTGNAVSSGGAGGGIYIGNGMNHQIINSTISNNNGADGCGGGLYSSAAVVTVTNTTFSGNTTTSYGGGICNDGGNTGAITVQNSTITGNTSGNVGGGGIVVFFGTLTIGNSIVAGNLGSPRADIYNSIGATPTTTGYNLIGSNAGSAALFPAGNPNANNDIVGTFSSPISPQLAPLGNYGGTVPTHALCTAANVPDASCTGASPAIDQGSAVAGITADARGVIRPYDIFTTANASGGNGADIGAFELVPTSEFGWGVNSSGQVGDGTLTNQSLPVQIAGGFTDIVSIEGGSNHALALRSNGTLLAWGSNDRGQLGDGTTTSKSSPVAVNGLTNVVAMAGGGYHSLALLADGTVMAWGYNSNGQLGNESATYSPTPVAVNGITNAVAVAAGNYSSYALLADGSVVAWGRNTSGQLGDGTLTQRSTPGQVSGLTGGVVQIDGGGSTVYAVLSDGSVRAWGSNNNGQIGDGTTTQRLTPVTPLNLTSGVVQIVGGFFYAAALKADGTLLTWGSNAEGELGDGTTTNNSTPTAISLPNVTQIKSSLGNVTFARLRDGSLYGWGSNFYGQVGNGTTATAQTTPVRVSIDAGIGFFGAQGNGGYAGSPLAQVSAGANQFVRLGDATVNFGNVATAGTTQIRTFAPSSSGLNLPSSYTIIANSNGYDITSSAQFTGNAQVCLKVPNVIDQTSFGRLYILHDDDGDGSLDAVNMTRDYQKRELCRATSSFSPFVVALGPLPPTAAGVSISGRVITPLNLGLTSALVTLTDMQGNSRNVLTGKFGTFRFREVTAGETYVLSVRSKRYVYAPQVITVTEDMTELDFAPQ